MKMRCAATAAAGLWGACGVAADTITFDPACETQQQLVVAVGRDLPSLLGQDVKAIKLYAKSPAGLSPVAFQIDPRDGNDRYEIMGPAPQAGTQLLDENDEVVFMAGDVGARLPADEAAAKGPLVELKVNNRISGESGWIYARISGKDDAHAGTASVHYDPATDSVQTPVYSIGFSRDTPFLVDTLKWNTGGGRQWSPDVLDTMKIRHRGKLFGVIDFTRTGDDYRSRIVAVKAGPLRVIRRTENAVRVLWKMSTPRIYADYIMNPDGFTMDTIIDIPFRMGLVFSELDTLTTVDWDSAPALPAITVASPDAGAGIIVNGEMSPEKSAFTQSRGTRFSAISALGSVHVELNIPEDLPITPWLYFNDALATADDPEQIPGQFGHVGFRTTGWENLDTEVRHLQFRVCLQPGGVTQ